MSRSRHSANARASSSKGARNRKVEAAGRNRAKKAVDPAERRTRNRTLLALALLAVVNGWVFFGRGGSLGELAGIGAAAIEDKGGPLPPLADPPAHPCGGDPVRIFEGLEQLLPLSTSLAGGMTLRLALLQLGIANDEIDRIEASVRTHVDLSLLGGSGAPLRLAMDRHGTVHALEIELAEGHILQACRGPEAGDFEVRNIQHPLRTDVEVVSLELGGDADLATAVVEAAEKPELAELIAAALAWDVDLMTEARPGDRIQVMVEKRWLGRRFHRYGATLAVRFVGAAARVAYFRYKPEGSPPAFFDPEGAPMRRALLRSPVGFHRVDPEARGLLPPSIEVVQGRLGAVYRLPEGAPLVALGDGEVTDVNRSASEGHVLELHFDDGTTARYAHVMRIVGELSVGTRVSQGQIVALAGHSGRTPSDRVRLELRRDDVDDGEGGTTTKVLDPMLLLGREAGRSALVGAPIPEAQKKRFLEDVAPWARALKLSR